MAGFDFMSGTMYTWLSSGLFWTIIIGVLVFGVVGGLIIRRETKFRYPCLIISTLGNGKVVIDVKKAGWFGNRTAILGLWDFGMDSIMRVKEGAFGLNGRLVQESSSVDYHDINGKRGLICFTKPDDPNVIVPISEVNIDKEGMEAIMKIAPSDFRGATDTIIEDSKRKMMGFFEKHQMLISIAIIAIVVLMVVMLSFKYLQGVIEAAHSYVCPIANTATATASTVAP